MLIAQHQVHPLVGRSKSQVAALRRKQVGVARFIEIADEKKWLVQKAVDTYDLSEGTSNYDRNGYLIYKSDHKVIVNE